jgi:hypothetical protein
MKLEKSIENMQTSLVKLEQTVNQLNSNPNRSSPIEEIQGLKGLFLNRSQIPSWQLKSFFFLLYRQSPHLIMISMELLFYPNKIKRVMMNKERKK